MISASDTSERPSRERRSTRPGPCSKISESRPSASFGPSGSMGDLGGQPVGPVARRRAVDLAGDLAEHPLPEALGLGWRRQREQPPAGAALLVEPPEGPVEG